MDISFKYRVSPRPWRDLSTQILCDQLFLHTSSFYMSRWYMEKNQLRLFEHTEPKHQHRATEQKESEISVSPSTIFTQYFSYLYTFSLSILYSALRYVAVVNIPWTTYKYNVSSFLVISHEKRRALKAVSGAVCLCLYGWVCACVCDVYSYTCLFIYILGLYWWLVV